MILSMVSVSDYNFGLKNFLDQFGGCKISVGLKGFEYLVLLEILKLAAV